MDSSDAGTVVTLADTRAGYGCIAHLPPGANGFTTIELKSNHLVPRATEPWPPVRNPYISARLPAGLGHHRHPLESKRTLALFRCTQLTLYSK